MVRAKRRQEQTAQKNAMNDRITQFNAAVQ